MPELSMRKLFRNLLGKQQADETSESGIDTLQETLLRLQQLVETRTFVDVKFPLKSHHNFQSLILKVNPTERYLLIDELFPTSRALMVSSGDLVEITSRSRGMPVKFKTTVQSVGIDDVDGMPAYRLALPGAVQAEQRRRNFRIPLGHESGVRLRIRNGDGSTMLCTVLNLSHGGVGFSASGNISERLREENVLNNTVLSLPTGEQMSLDLEVRSFDFRRHPYRHTTVGSRILRISPNDEKLIDQYLVSVQRQLRREALDDEHGGP